MALRFTLDNPNITEQTTTALLSALRQIYAERPSLSDYGSPKPIVTVISSTGITQPSQPNDVPLLLKPVYCALAIPHADKRRMEELLQGEEAKGIISGWVFVRPTMLTGDHSITSGKGWETLKVGKESKPAVGYTIARADVGEWVYNEVVVGEGQKWVGEKVTLTS